MRLLSISPIQVNVAELHFQTHPMAGSGAVSGEKMAERVQKGEGMCGKPWLFKQLLSGPNCIY